MTIIYRDEIGAVMRTVDKNGVSFCDGFAYFTDTDGNDYCVSMYEILAIA